MQGITATKTITGVDELRIETLVMSRKEKSNRVENRCRGFNPRQKKMFPMLIFQSIQTFHFYQTRVTSTKATKYFRQSVAYDPTSRFPLHDKATRRDPLWHV